MSVPVDFNDIQGLVRFGHGKLTEASFWLLNLRDPSAAREMNRRHTRQASAIVDVPSRVVDHPEEEREDPAAKQSRLDAAHSAELVGDVMVFEVRELSSMPRIDAGRDLGIGRLAAPQLKQEKRKI